MTTPNNRIMNIWRDSKSRIIFNKYTLSLLAFVVWMTFLDGHNLISQHKLKDTIATLKLEKEKYKKDIAEAKELRQDIEQNKERYAREKYYMHKENEKVFIMK